MPKIALVGDSTSLLGFRPLGIDFYALDNPKEITEKWAEIMAKGYAIIFITEPIYQEALDLVKEVEGLLTPAITVIPPTTGSTGVGLEHLKSLIQKAVGTELREVE